MIVDCCQFCVHVFHSLLSFGPLFVVAIPVAGKVEKVVGKWKTLGPRVHVAPSTKIGKRMGIVISIGEDNDDKKWLSGAKNISYQRHWYLRQFAVLCGNHQFYCLICIDIPR